MKQTCILPDIAEYFIYTHFIQFNCHSDLKYNLSKYTLVTFILQQVRYPQRCLSAANDR